MYCSTKATQFLGFVMLEYMLPFFKSGLRSNIGESLGVWSIIKYSSSRMGSIGDSFCRNGESGILTCQCGHHLSSGSFCWVLITGNIFCVTSQRRWGKMHTLGALHLGIYSVIVLEARGLKATSCQQDGKLSSASMKESFHVSCSFWCPE